MNTGSGNGLGMRLSCSGVASFSVPFQLLLQYCKRQKNWAGPGNQASSCVGEGVLSIHRM